MLYASCTLLAVQCYHTSCDAQYFDRKKKPSGRFGGRSSAEAHCVKLTEIAVQYATAVVQVLNITAMK